MTVLDFVLAAAGHPGSSSNTEDQAAPEPPAEEPVFAEAAIASALRVEEEADIALALLAGEGNDIGLALQGEEGVGMAETPVVPGR